MLCFVYMIPELCVCSAEIEVFCFF